MSKFWLSKFLYLKPKKSIKAFIASLFPLSDFRELEVLKKYEKSAMEVLDLIEFASRQKMV